MIQTGRPIVLLTDFGLSDGFVGVLKGVIADIAPQSRVIDLSHGVEAQNILQASFLLSTHYSYFPKPSIFCVVVDPGVGSNRKAICIQTQNHIFVGPDNGVLWQAACLDGIKRIFQLSNSRFFLDNISQTFHGRDIFAPVSAHLSKGIKDLSDLGNTLDQCTVLDLPRIVEKGRDLKLTVLAVDRFGNVGLNISRDQFKNFVKDRPFRLEINNFKIDQIHDYYSQADSKQLFLIPASSGFIEISLKNGNAASMMEIHPLETGVLTLVFEN